MKKKLSGRQHSALANALLSAFPTQTALERMVKYSLGKGLAEIATGDNLREIVFRLVQWAESQGQIGKLLTKAHNSNPQNPELNKIYQEFLQKGIIDSSRRARQRSSSNSTLNISEKTPKPLNKSVSPKHKTAITAPSALNVQQIKGIQDSTYLSEANWRDNFGLERSPFEGLESGREDFIEPSFLTNCFVDPDCFLDVLGQANAPTTVILYARRGEGKTACRVMVEAFCKNGGVPEKRTGQSAYVLSVPHILSEIAYEPTLEQHVREIMERAVPRFVDLLASSAIVRDRINASPKNILSDINWYLDFYGRHLIHQQMAMLVQMGFNIPFDSSTLPFLRQRGSSSPIDHLKQWCYLINAVGIKAVYVLVDGLDEKTDTAADLQNAYRILLPLVTNRELVDKVPYFALKFFLPAEIENSLNADARSRPELIPILHINWTQEKLIELLRQRINYFRRTKYRQQSVPGFDEFCVPELYGWIEPELVKTAGLNPRHVLKLCDLMVKAHCQNADPSSNNPYLLTHQDFDIAKQKFSRLQNRLSTSKNQLSTHHDSWDIRSLIEGGETETVEFKSSLLRDLATNQQNDGLIMKIGKEIAGMLNRSGGALIIGVADDKTILGIDGDFEFLGQRNKSRASSKKLDLDGFQMKVVDLIKDQMGTHVLGLVTFRFDTFGEGTVCTLIIQPSSQPVYFGKMEEFYIRSATSNLRLSTKGIVSYVKEHWPG